MFCNRSTVGKIKVNRQWNFIYRNVSWTMSSNKYGYQLSKACQALHKNVLSTTTWQGTKHWTVSKNYAWLTCGTGLFCILRFPHTLLLHASQYQVLSIWNRQSTEDAFFWIVMPYTRVDQCWHFIGTYHNGPSRFLGKPMFSNLSTLCHERSLHGYQCLNFKIHRQSTV